MNNYLEIDLNEIASKQIRKQIESLNAQVDKKTKEANDYYNKWQKLKDNQKEYSQTEFFLNAIRLAYSELKAIPKTNDNYGKDLYDVRTDFIKELLKTIFNIQGVNRYSGQGIKQILAANYYEHKDIVSQVLKMLMPEKPELIQYISTYKLPKDYSKEQVLKFISGSISCTNGCYFGPSQYWDGGTGSLPLDLIFVNPFILDEDVFSIILEKCKGGYSSELFRVYAYADLSKDQIERLGSCLLSKSLRTFSEVDHIKGLIKSRISDFNKETLDYLFQWCSHDNQYNLFYWTLFPYEYQCKYLNNVSISACLELVKQTKWTDEEKETFLRNRLTQKL